MDLMGDFGPEWIYIFIESLFDGIKTEIICIVYMRIKTRIICMIGHRATRG
jgi:hypothetical protein